MKRTDISRLTRKEQHTYIIYFVGKSLGNSFDPAMFAMFEKVACILRSRGSQFLGKVSSEGSLDLRLQKKANNTWPLTTAEDPNRRNRRLQSFCGGAAHVLRALSVGNGCRSSIKVEIRERKSSWFEQRDSRFSGEKECISQSGRTWWPLGHEQ